MKDIEAIVKEVADRYGVEYDENSTGPKIRCGDGTIKYLDTKDIEKLFEDVELDNSWHELKIMETNQFEVIKLKNDHTAKKLAAVSC